MAIATVKVSCRYGVVRLQGRMNDTVKVFGSPSAVYGKFGLKLEYIYNVILAMQSKSSNTI